MNSVLLSNAKKDFSFRSSHRDSLSEIYYNNLSLRCNTNTKTYWLQNFEHDDALSEFEGVFQPFVDKTFNDYFVDDSVYVEKIEGNGEKSVLKV